MNTYTEEEMVLIFKDIFELDISKKEMLNYKPDLVQKIYMCFLRDFGASVEKLNMVPLNAPPLMLQYPDMFRNTGFLVRLGKCVQYYLNLISKSDEFEIIDIIQPNPKRTKRFLSIFIDFYIHIKENFNCFEEVESEIEMRRLHHEKIKQDIESFKKEIKKREMKNAETEVCLEKSQKACEAVKSDVEAGQEMKTRLKGRLEGLKQEINDLVTHIKEKELNILEAGEKIEALKTQVIQEQEHEDIKEREASLSALKISKAELKETAKELRHNLQILQKTDSLLKDTVTPTLEEYEQILQKKEEIISLKEEKEKAKLHEKIEELSQCEQMLNDRFSFLQDEKKQIHHSRELKKKGKEEDIKQLKLTFEEQQRKKEEHEIVEKDLNSEYENTLKEIETMKLNTDSFLKDFKFSMNELKVKFENVAKRDLEEVMKKSSQDKRK